MILKRAVLILFQYALCSGIYIFLSALFAGQGFFNQAVTWGFSLFFFIIFVLLVFNDSNKLAFKDNGIGFDQIQSEKIFLIFHRLHGQEPYGGTGIGLALCKSIVHNHQGEITATSTKGQGSVFQVILPVSHK